MRSRARAVGTLVGAVLLFLSTAGISAAEPGRTGWLTGPSVFDDPERGRDWSVDTILYLWMASANADLTAPAIGTVSGGATFQGLAANLEAGFAGVIDLRYRRWHLVSDNSWVKLSDAQLLPGPAQATLDTTLSSAFGTVAATYELPTGGATAFELVLGARWWHMGVDATLTPPGASSSSDTAWADAVGGLRIRHRITDQWMTTLGADVGGGGSDLTWQVYSSLQYRIARHVGVAVGYRVISVERAANGNRLDLRQNGLVLGLGFSL